MLVSSKTHKSRSPRCHTFSIPETRDLGVYVANEIEEGKSKAEGQRVSSWLWEMGSGGYFYSDSGAPQRAGMIARIAASQHLAELFVKCPVPGRG